MDSDAGSCCLCRKILKKMNTKEFTADCVVLGGRYGQKYFHGASGKAGIQGGAQHSERYERRRYCLTAVRAAG